MDFIFWLSVLFLIGAAVLMLVFFVLLCVVIKNRPPEVERR
jgi:hypothetical protein